MSEIIPGYYDTAGAMVVLNVSRAAVSKIAKAEGWSSEKVGNSHLFHADDVHEYRDHQARTKLVKALGWVGRGFYRYKGIDIPCPICEGFAVETVKTPNQLKIYLCLNGHYGHKGDI